MMKVMKLLHCGNSLPLYLPSILKFITEYFLPVLGSSKDNLYLLIPFLELLVTFNAMDFSNFLPPKGKPFGALKTSPGSICPL